MLATVVVPIFLAIKMSLYADVLYQAAGLPLHRPRQLHPPDRRPGVLADAVEFRGLGVRLGVLQFIFGFAAALLLQQAFRGRALVRTLTLLPWIIPGVVVGLIWQWLYQPNYGVLNDLLIRVG